MGLHHSTFYKLLCFCPLIGALGNSVALYACLTWWACNGKNACVCVGICPGGIKKELHICSYHVICPPVLR